MADPNIPAISGISDADVARVLLYQGQRSVHAPLAGVVSKDYVQSLLSVSDFALTYLDDADAAAMLTTLGVSSFAKTLLDDADAAAARTTLGAVNKAGDTITGVATIGVGTVGRIALTPGSAAYPGYVSFLTPEGTRRGYMGWASGDYLTLTGENGWGWRVVPGTEFRVSGSFLAEGGFEVNTATPNFTGISSSGINLNRDTDGAVMTFVKPFPTGAVGSITISGSSTAYNTSSDYRLKINYEPIADALDRITALTAYRGEFIADPGRKVDYFLAHEAQEVVPEAVTGEKDAVDEDGKPVYQGIDQSKLVPLHHAALRAMLTKIEALEARVAALESA